MFLTKNQEINSKSINEQWKQQKETTKKTSYGILWYTRESKYQKWMCVQDEFLHAKSKLSTASPPTHGKHIQLPNGIRFCPLCCTAMSDGWQYWILKNGWRWASNVRRARWLACVLSYMHLCGVWVWEVEGGDNGPRRFRPRDNMVWMFLDENKNTKQTL